MAKFRVHMTARLEFFYAEIEAPTSGDAGVVAGDRTRAALAAGDHLPYVLTDLFVHRLDYESDEDDSR